MNYESLSFSQHIFEDDLIAIAIDHRARIVLIQVFGCIWPSDDLVTKELTALGDTIARHGNDYAFIFDYGDYRLETLTGEVVPQFQATSAALQAFRVRTLIRIIPVQLRRAFAPFMTVAGAEAPNGVNVLTMEEALGALEALRLTEARDTAETVPTFARHRRDSYLQ